jgi:heme oxygenase
MDRSATVRIVADVLHTRTRDVHSRVECGLNLTAGNVTVPRLGAVVARLDTFWSGTEPAIEDWALRQPEQAAALNWPRRRARLVSADLAFLGGERDGAPAPTVFESAGTADVLGWLYVREGSTLGGAVINAQLRDLLGGRSLRSFSPYAEGPQPLWRSYLAELDRWVGSNAARENQVTSAAVSTFVALERWLAPLLLTLATAADVGHLR